MKIFDTFRTLRWRWAVALAIVGALTPTATTHAAATGLKVTVTDYLLTTLPGQEITYTLRVANATGGTIATATADIVLDSNVTFVDASNMPTNLGAGRYQWTFTNLPNGTTFRYVTVNVKAPLASGTVLATGAEVDDTSGTPNLGWDMTTIQAPRVVLSRSVVDFGTQRVGSTSAAQMATLTNSGDAPLSGIVITMPASDFTQTNDCGATLAIGASCTITALFAPTAAGPRTGTISITSNAVGSPHTISLTGTGTQPTAQASPASLTFGNQIVGSTSAPQTVTLTNTGNAPLAISSIVVSGDFSRSTTCGATLDPAASCTIDLTFTPTTTGARTGALTISDDATTSPQVINLNGTGATLSVQLAPGSLTFGNQAVGTTSATQAVTLTNSGTLPLTINGIAASGDFGQTTTCVSPIAPGASCTISVSFTPTANGTRTGAISISDNVSGSPQTVNLTGTGTAPVATLAPTSLDFDSRLIGSASAAQTAIFTNSGSAPLLISAISVIGGSDYAATNDCPIGPATLAAGAFCTFTVTFTPTAAGSRSGLVTITHNASGSQSYLNLAGIGVAPAPAVTLAPASLNFGNSAVGTTSAAQPLMLTNSGTAALAIGAIAASGDFAQTNTCPASLAINATCQIDVTFTPTAGGNRSGLLTITDNAANSPQAVTLSGAGIAPQYTSAPGTGPLSLTSVIGSANSVTITVSNGGLAPLTVSAPLDLISAPFRVSPTAAYSVAVGGSTAVVVTCAPAAAGPYTQSLRYSTNDPAQSTVTYLVTCAGTTTPTATFNSSPAPGGTLAMGNVRVGQSSGTNLIVSESGTAALIIGLNGGMQATAITGPNASSFAVTAPALPLTIADGAAQRTLTITCRPGVAQALSATLTLQTNDPTQATVSYPLTCTGFGSTTFMNYLPLLAHAMPPADLVVESFTVTPTSLETGELVRITATVKNTGGQAATGFWVDFYINPATVPTTANLTWNETCGTLKPCYGIAWFVTGLAPGASITLTSDASGFVAANSNWAGTFAPGTSDVYLYVDSWNRNDATGVRVPDGAVLESNETNNRAAIHDITVTGTTLAASAGAPALRARSLVPTVAARP